MDWKSKCAQYWEKTKIIWADVRKGCGAAWKRLRVFLGDSRIRLRKVWNVVNVWLTKAKVWLKKALAFLGKYGKYCLGWLAVLALRGRKWTLKTTARLRGWWAGWEGRKWLAAKLEKTRNQLPAPAAQPLRELPEEEVVQQPPVVMAPPRPVSRSRKLGPFAATMLKIWNGIKTTVMWIYRLRRYIMAAPVAFYAVKLAFANAHRLPELVGLDIQASGEFARMVSRPAAVLGPLGITGFCLVLVICSRKPLLPWLISIFTLILPVLIWMTNYYA